MAQGNALSIICVSLDWSSFLHTTKPQGSVKFVTQRLEHFTFTLASESYFGEQKPSFSHNIVSIYRNAVYISNIILKL